MSSRARKKERWPRVRDIIFRPDRIGYVRKAVAHAGCVFCTARDQGVTPESLCVYRDDRVMAVLNKFPYNTGHIMVLPIRHCGNLLDLSDEEYHSLQQLLRMTVQIVKTEYGVDGINVGLNMGRIAGAGLPDHLHWHVVPRWMGDTNFFPLIAETKVLPETLEQTFSRYIKHFERQK